MGTLLRAIEILDLFDAESGAFTLEDVVERLGLTKSTAYRYLRDLITSGLLTSTDGQYRLGARIIELERVHARTDPLVQAGRKLIKPDAAGNAVYLLSTIFNDKALCVLKAGPDHIEDRMGNAVNVLRQQGVAFPLFHGAASQAMLAYLPTAKLKSFYLQYIQEIEAHDLGTSWAEFRTALSRIRSNGYALAIATEPHRLSGLAVPVHARNGKLLGSLSMAFANGTPAEPRDFSEMSGKLGALASEIANAHDSLSAIEA